MLLHYAIRLRPKDEKEPSCIPSDICSSFNDEMGRGALISWLGPPRGDWLDLAWAPLQELFRELAVHLDGDLHWLSKEENYYTQMTEASYLREVFQRLILNFLVKNWAGLFMHQEKHPENRKIEKKVQKDEPLNLIPDSHDNRRVGSEPATMTRR